MKCPVDRGVNARRGQRDRVTDLVYIVVDQFLHTRIQLQVLYLMRICSHRVISDDHSGKRILFDAVHVLQPRGPFTRIHPGEDHSTLR